MTDLLQDRILAGELPSYLDGDQLPRDTSKFYAELVPTFLDTDWDDETPPIVPSILGLGDGRALLYAGESHTLAGPGGVGKSWVAMHAIAELVRNDARAVGVFVDYEDSRRTFRTRLHALGVTKAEAARIAYWQPVGTMMQSTAAGIAWLEWVDAHRPSLVVIDSVSKACASAGFNDNAGPEFQQWDNGVIMPLTRRGVATLRIDHTGHDTGFGSAGKRERGASEKPQAVSGASYLFEVVSGWSRETGGSALLRVLKDRHGSLVKNSIAAVVNVDVRESGAYVRITLDAPSVIASSVESGKNALTAASRVLRALEALNVWATVGAVQEWDAEHRPLKLDGELAAPLKSDTVRKALERLDEDGKVQHKSDGRAAYYAALGVSAALVGTTDDGPPF